MYSLLSRALFFRYLLGIDFKVYVLQSDPISIWFLPFWATIMPGGRMFSSFSSSLFYSKTRATFLSIFSLSRTDFNSVWISSNLTSNCLSSSFIVLATYDSPQSTPFFIQFFTDFRNTWILPDLGVPTGTLQFFLKLFPVIPPCVVQYLKYCKQVWRNQVHIFMVLNFIEKQLVFNINFFVSFSWCHEWLIF